MGGTKIFVLQMKDLIRVGVFAVLGIVLLVLLLVFLVPRGRAEGPSPDEGYPPRPTTQARFVPGTYAATIVLNDEPVQVRVTVSAHEILSIDMTEMGEVSQVFYPLFEPTLQDLAEEVLRFQSAYIEPRTDNPVTTGILQQAIIAALRMAYAEYNGYLTD